MHLKRKMTLQSQNVGLWIMWLQLPVKTVEFPNVQLNPKI